MTGARSFASASGTRSPVGSYPANIGSAFSTTSSSSSSSTMPKAMAFSWLNRAIFMRSAYRRGIRDQPLAEARDLVDLVTEAAVELDHAGVRGPHLEVELRAPALGEQALGLGHEPRAETLAASRTIDRQVVHPAAVPVVADHRRRDHGATRLPHEEQLGLHAQLALDVAIRVVPRHDEPGRAPQRDDRFGVGTIERPDAQFGRRAGAVHTSSRVSQPWRSSTRPYWMSVSS